MIYRKELKEKTLSQLKNNWGFAILVCLIYTIISGVLDLNYTFEPNINWIDFNLRLDFILIIVLGPLHLGLSKFILNFIEDRSKSNFKDLFYGFFSINLFIKSILINLIIVVGIYIGGILFIIPGIIWALMFSQTYFILVENTEIGVIEALKRSYKLVDGFKSDLFILELSFIGWLIVCIITLGIGFLWYTPYYEITLGNFYVKLKEIKSKVD
ncbi:integral membrane protein [[Clostridium] sordellii]|uniref:Integral membrane protein n=2 Tax=Paraclostridium sordellii TaxID=1505 RepID=A0A0C7G8P8_PARSO|nr:DUF975 family protein [Paeniclostridium sordellii]CEN78291.1 integral membrane protein [[Clostridium] sordellii] [Paeniclostridium sordellii]CEQ03382.1 integral membrane protein [[Clostridium] sordellii] [Paeniclostridium sordellii]